MFAPPGYPQPGVPSQWYIQAPPTTWQQYAPKAPPPPPPNVNPNNWAQGRWGLHPQFQNVNPHVAGVQPTAWGASGAWSQRDTDPVCFTILL